MKPSSDWLALPLVSADSTAGWFGFHRDGQHLHVERKLVEHKGNVAPPTQCCGLREDLPLINTHCHQHANTHTHTHPSTAWFRMTPCQVTQSTWGRGANIDSCWMFCGRVDSYNDWMTETIDDAVLFLTLQQRSSREGSVTPRGPE